MEKNNHHQHGGKSSESLMDKELILKHLAVTSGQTVLDAGCGNGYMAKEFARLVGDSGFVSALDPHEPSIEILKQETAGNNIAAFVGDITCKTALPASSVDLIYLSTVFHGFSETDIQGFVKEAKRLLKPVGTLAVVEIVKKETPFGPPLDLRFSPEELRAAVDLKPAGCFDVGEFFYMQLFNKGKR